MSKNIKLAMTQTSADNNKVHHLDITKLNRGKFLCGNKLKDYASWELDDAGMQEWMQNNPQALCKKCFGS